MHVSGPSMGKDDLPKMMAMLCTYDNMFGPYAPQTMKFTKEVGVACWRMGDRQHARILLSRAVRDLGQYLGRGHQRVWKRFRALQELLIAEGELTHAATMQQELLDSALERYGAGHPETVAVHERFLTLLETLPNQQHVA